MERSDLNRIGNGIGHAIGVVAVLVLSFLVLGIISFVWATLERMKDWWIGILS